MKCGGGRSQPCFDPFEQLNVASDLGNPASQTPDPFVSEICSPVRTNGRHLLLFENALWSLHHSTLLGKYSFLYILSSPVILSAPVLSSPSTQEQCSASQCAIWY